MPMTYRIELDEVAISEVKFAALGRKRQFVYLLLGEIHNELMTLQKLISFAFPKDSTTSIALRRAEPGQAMMLTRLALGKMHEAQLALKGQVVEALVKGEYLPLIEDGLGRYALCWTQQKVDLPWLADMRNHHGFHYPRFDAWKNYLESITNKDSLRIYVGTASGNTFYAASEAIAQHAFFWRLVHKRMAKRKLRKTEPTK